MTQALKILKLDETEITRRGIRNWPVWERKVSRFSYYYEREEQCLFLEGEVIIEAGTDRFVLKAGDYVIFPKDLDCIWDIRQSVKKHYHFE